MTDTYTKLFGSLLDSTVWREADHVVRVWIAMLCMKDADGIVDASIPGLADRARKSVSETEDALRVLMAPDKYSRTKDYDGRRIVEVENGWRVLNHEKYRGMQGAVDRRKKKAARQARWRANDRARRSVDGGDVSVDVSRPHTDTHTEDQSKSARSGSGSTPSSFQASGSRGQRDLVNGPGAARARGFEVPHSSAHDATTDAPSHDSPADALPDRSLREYIWYAEKRINAMRHDVAVQYGLDPGRHQHPTAQDTADAMARLRESGATAKDALDHALAMAIAEARKKRTLEHLGWCIFRANAWSAKMRQTAQSIASSGSTSPTDTALEVLAELEAKEERGEP